MSELRIDNALKLKECEGIRRIKDFDLWCHEAKSILSSIGYDEYDIKEIKLSKSLKKPLGMYYENDKHIEVNLNLYRWRTDVDVINTIIHEILHNITHIRYGNQSKNNGHTKEWNRIAKEVSSKTGYKIEQYASDNEFNFYYKVPRKEILEYTHYFRCKECGHTQCSKSKFENPDKLLKQQKCERCLCANKIHGDNKKCNDFECIKTEAKKKLKDVEYYM